MKSLKYGDLFTIDEFCELLDGNELNAYDGFGYYAIGEYESTELVDFRSDIVRWVVSVKGYTGVIWYNK